MTITLQIIGFFNCLGKVIEKLVVIQLSEFYKAKKKLHKSQIGGKKLRSAIDATAFMIHKVYEI